VRCALGASLAEVGWSPGLAADAPLVAVKTPVGSLWRLPGVDPVPGPEMRSTGEVLGLASTFSRALEVATEAAAQHER
jgi:carbamoyl-phosphate synthase large subunit